MEQANILESIAAKSYMSGNALLWVAKSHTMFMLIGVHIALLLKRYNCQGHHRSP